jgi:chemotaxis protein methyltransferase CheR
MIVAQETLRSHRKLFIETLDKQTIKELLEILGDDISYEITLLNTQFIPLKLLLHFEKIKSQVSFIVNEEKLKYYLLNLGFKVESVYDNKVYNINIADNINYVGIGGSAGSLKKFIEIIKYLPPSNMVFFIIMHQKNDVPSYLNKILQKYTTHYTLINAEDNLKVEPSSIYIASPGKHMLIKDGYIFLSDSEAKNFSKPSISVTFKSLSQEYREKFLAIIVCGYGADGSDALKQIREHGGIVFIEQLYECQATPMLENAINTKQFDKILSIRDISTILYEKITKENSIEENLDFFLEEIYLKYGYDYRGYQKKHLKRRIEHFYNEERYERFADLKEDVLTKRKVFEELFLDLSINVTTFFRNPKVFETLRQEIKERFLDNNSIKIWCAGCSSGEEPYSIAILLKELGVLEKSLIYATDINDVILEYAKNGAYSKKSFEVFKEHYQQANGVLEFENYFNSYSDFVTVNKEIKDKILFFKHNLSLGKTLNQFQVIICRNVIIYFNKNLTMKVFQLFDNSLDEGGLLLLGESETLYDEFQYKVVSEDKKIYQKVSADA